MTIATVWQVVSIAAVVVTTAGAICAMTKTPPPDTAWGKVYRGIEIAALLIGRAKDSGLIPDNKAADVIAQEVIGETQKIIPGAKP